MSVYHQMGHGSVGLLSEPHLQNYKGAILSPVNYSQAQISAQTRDHQKEDFELVFDPQLYYPTTRRGKLPDWSYFPSDVDTADLGSLSWWRIRVTDLADALRRFGPRSVCSPAVVPRVTSYDYYVLNAEVANLLKTEVEQDGVEVLQTLLVKVEDLSQPDTPHQLASIVSGAKPNRVYLVLISDVAPRYELRETEELKGAMRLIRLLEDAQIRVVVACVSSDVILWKAAGASTCATGKFFNLRRFTPSRWRPPAEGGGQASYWFEESMMAFLREDDVLRVREAQFLSAASLSNPYCGEILSVFDSGRQQPWLSLGWKQYLYWVMDFEMRQESGQIDPDDVLSNSERVWQELDSRNIFMDERRNDGAWLRPWKRALAEAPQ